MTNESDDGHLDELNREELIETVKRHERELDEIREKIDKNLPRGTRWKSERTLWGRPIVCVATGPDPETGEMRGHAKGIIAIGDIATGVLAIGGISRGIVSLGGCAVGGLAFGGCSVGFVSIGGLAVGLFAALGGLAVGGIALGGQAFGYHAFGTQTFGIHVHPFQDILRFFDRF